MLTRLVRLRGLHQVADIDQARAGAAVERRADVGVDEIEPGGMHDRLVGGDLALEGIDARLLLVANLDGLVALGRGLEIALEVEQGALQPGLVLGAIGRCLVEHCLEGPRIDLEEPIAFLDVLSFLEGDLDDRAVDTGLDHGGVERLDGADAAHIDRHVAFLCDRHGYRDGGRRHRRSRRSIAPGVLQEQVARACHDSQRADGSHPGEDVLPHFRLAPSPRSLADFTLCVCH